MNNLHAWFEKVKSRQHSVMRLAFITAVELVPTKLKELLMFLCHAGRIRTHGIGGGHKQRYRCIDFQRLRYEPNKDAQPFEEKVVEVRYDPCRWDQRSPRSDTFDEVFQNANGRRWQSVLHRSADIALVAGGNRKRWIIATENMQAGDVIKTSGIIGHMAGIRSAQTFPQDDEKVD